MPRFGKRSLANLETCHPDLQKILYEGIKWIDFSIIQGYRGEEEQNLYYHQGKSKLKYPDSKHNTKNKNGLKLSLAGDVAPYPIDWDDKPRFFALAFFLKGIASRMDINLRIGADWDGNFKINESFIDLPHIELKSKLICGVWVKYEDTKEYK